MICHSRRSVRHIYRAASLKAVPFNLLLHHDIACMGVYSDVCVVSFAICNSAPEYAVNISVACYSMDGYIFIVIEPFAIFDMFICWF